MKTKALFLSIVALLMSATLSAQTIIKGDMNDDDQVTIADVTSLVNVILGKAPQETINVGGGRPYAVDNSMVVGTWYAPDGTSFEFNADGTTTFPDGATYEFMPVQGRLLVYDAASQPVKVLPILKAEPEFLLTVDYATNLFTYYTKSNPQPQETAWYYYAGWTLPTASNVDAIIAETYPSEKGSTTMHTAGKKTTSKSTMDYLSNTLYNANAKATYYVLVPTGQAIYDSLNNNVIASTFTSKGNITVGNQTHTVYASNGTSRNIGAIIIK